jgi:hypoxanthine phosphoribosyltransferase
MAGAENSTEKPKLRLTYDDVERMSVTLADQIITSGMTRPERVLILPRGSLMPANIVTRFLNIKGHEILSAGVTSYVNGATERTDFTIGQFPTEEDVADKDILAIDEVCDTGHTLDYVTRRLRTMGGRVTSAVLHYKPTHSETGFVPDYYVEETDTWVVYPWEVHEAAGFEMFPDGQLIPAAATLDA